MRPCPTVSRPPQALDLVLAYHKGQQTLRCPIRLTATVRPKTLALCVCVYGTGLALVNMFITGPYRCLGVCARSMRVCIVHVRSCIADDVSGHARR